MRRHLLASAVAALGAASLVVGGAFAHGPGPMHPGAGRVIDVKASKTGKLWILHVQKGCHSWTDGKQIGETVRLSITGGGKLKVLNQDLDGHRLIQTKGRRIAVGSPLGLNMATVLAFPRVGSYRFRTKSFELEGLPEIKTTGPDHGLFLIVTVR